MTKFRPCIDIHDGKVKQIVGGTLKDEGEGPRENFVASEGPRWFAERFRKDDLRGGHVIKLGPGNDEAGKEALAAWPGGMQIGGGIGLENAAKWLELGASQVIVTSWLFEEGLRFSEQRVKDLAGEIGADRLVIDLSCRKDGSGWVVATNRWQTRTDMNLTPRALDRLAPHCSEFLIHAADVEGLCRGIDRELVTMLGDWTGRPVTYAGGASRLADVELVDELSRGGVDVTVGSALDIFGGSGVGYQELVDWNKR